MDKRLRETTNLGVDDSSWPKATSLTPMIFLTRLQEN